MTEEIIQCIKCSKEIKAPNKEIEDISFISPLPEDERILEIKEIIKTQNFEGIHKCVCVNCFHESIKEMKEKLTEEGKKLDDCLKALKDLLLDISNKKEINEITGKVLDEKGKLEKDYKDLINNRKNLENDVKKKKDDLRKLKDEEQKLYIKLNENIRKEKEKEIYKQKLRMKKQYLEKIYQQLKEN